MAPNISVCMATYNGAAYLREQMSSILSQLGPDDEIIVSDDGSSDETCDIVESYQDNRIRLIRNGRNLGHVQNFAQSIALARGRYIALSDQDDIWVEGRLQKLMVALDASPKNLLAVGDFLEIDAAGALTGHGHAMGHSPTSMLRQMVLILMGRARYFGCTFMFRQDFRKHILPIPGLMDSHDIWIALNACLFGRIAHAREVCLLHRIHGRNLTPSRRRSLPKVVRSRIIYITGICQSIVKGLASRGVGGR